MLGLGLEKCSYLGGGRTKALIFLKKKGGAYFSPLHKSSQPFMWRRNKDRFHG